jgi:hypothetical protein
MQPSNQDLIDYSPVPDSPPQSPREPEMLNASMRSDQSPVFTRQHRFWRHRHRTQHRAQQSRPQERRPRWRVQVQVPEENENEEEERRIFKGNWGPGRCRPSRRQRRQPPPSPPAAAASGLNQRTMAIAAHGGTRKTLKNRSRNRSRKCKSTRRKCQTRRAGK